MPVKNQLDTSALNMFYKTTFEGNDLLYSNQQLRMNSFLRKGEISWPFLEDCSCTPETMADAGFYFVGTEKEPDLARCYWCRRELDGWEPTDDPWKEHERRSCPFINLKKRQDLLSKGDFLKLEMERQTLLMEKLFEKSSVALQEKSDELRLKMETYGKNSANSKSKRKRKY